jgi:hypothetical protein
MSPQIIPAKKIGNTIRPMHPIPAGGSIFILWVGQNDFFQEPPKSSSAKEIRKDFEKTGKYSAAFLNSLEKGLSKSSLFKKKS